MTTFDEDITAWNNFQQKARNALYMFRNEAPKNWTIELGRGIVGDHHLRLLDASTVLIDYNERITFRNLHDGRAYNNTIRIEYNVHLHGFDIDVPIFLIMPHNEYDAIA